MMDARDRVLVAQAARVAHIPSEADFDQIHVQANELAREWTPRPPVPRLHATDAHQGGGRGGLFGDGVSLGGAERDSHDRASSPMEMQPSWRESDVSLSGRVTDVTAWHEGWVGAIESCVTEIGLSLESRVWIAVDANRDELTFRVDADGPERSWQRNLQLVRGVLTDTEHGEIWDFKTVNSDR